MNTIKTKSKPLSRYSRLLKRMQQGRGPFEMRQLLTIVTPPHKHRFKGKDICPNVRRNKYKKELSLAQQQQHYYETTNS